MESKLYIKTPDIEKMEMLRSVLNGIAFVDILQNQGAVSQNLFDYHEVVGAEGYWVCLTDVWNGVPTLAQPIMGAIFEILPQIQQPNTLGLEVIVTDTPVDYGLVIEGEDPAIIE